MSAKRTKKPGGVSDKVLRGQANLGRIRRMGEREIRATSPGDLADLPADFWDQASVVSPVQKEAISLRVDADVLEWFREQGPKYQSRMNAVLRSFMTQRIQSTRKAG